MDIRTINLELTIDELNFVLTALGELPAKNSMALIGKIQMIAEEQVKPQIIKPEQDGDKKKEK